MTEYKTIEGHKIIAGECYETRDGRKVFISKDVIGITEGDTYASQWYEDGMWSRMNNRGKLDLMRPWGASAIECKKCNDSGLIDMTYCCSCVRKTYESPTP